MCCRPCRLILPQARRKDWLGDLSIKSEGLEKTNRKYRLPERSRNSSFVPTRWTGCSSQEPSVLRVACRTTAVGRPYRTVRDFEHVFKNRLLDGAHHALAFGLWWSE